jgi:SAM-dependent methyltransferase
VVQDRGVRDGGGSAETDASDVFDEPSTWRVEAVLYLGLEGEARMAGAATGVAYPLSLDPIVNALDVGSGSRLCDVGAGLGGPAQWIARRTGASVVAVEQASAAAAGAHKLFPDLDTVRAHAVSLPFGAGGFDAVTLLGVVSLVADLTALLHEVVRVLRPGGRLGVTDLCLVSGPVVQPPDSPNTFRSLADVVEAIERQGFRVSEIAAGKADVTGRWDGVGQRVDQEIERRHHGSPTFRTWVEDRRRLGEAISAGELHVASLVAEHSTRAVTPVGGGGGSPSRPRP